MKPSERYVSLVTYYAERAGLPPDLAYRQMLAESSANPNAVSPSGAQGLFQLMPATARELKVQNPLCPEQSIRGGTEYLAGLLYRIRAKWPTISEQDSLKMALAGYNGGIGYVYAAARALPLANGEAPTWDAIAAELPNVVFKGKKPDHKQIIGYVGKIMPS